jgi:hypothetical protein
MIKYWKVRLGDMRENKNCAALKGKPFKYCTANDKTLMLATKL